MIMDRVVIVIVFCAMIEAYEHKLVELRKLDSPEKIPATGESTKLEESQLYYIKSILSLLNKIKATKDQNKEATNFDADPKDFEDTDEVDLDIHSDADESEDNGITNNKSRQLELIDYFTGDWYDNLKKHEQGDSEGKEQKENTARRLDIEINDDDLLDDDDIDDHKFYDDVDINGGYIPRRFEGDTMIETKGRTAKKLGERTSDPSPQLQGNRRFFFSPIGIRGLYLKPGTYQQAAPTNPHAFTFSNINSRDIFTLNHEVKQPSVSLLQPIDLVPPSVSKPSGLLPSGLNFHGKYRRLESGNVGASTEAVAMTSFEKNDNAYPFEPNQSVSGYLKKRLRL